MIYKYYIFVDLDYYLLYNTNRNIILEDIIMDNNNQNQNTYKTVTFSKDNPIIEISSKQSQIQEQNITP